MINDLQVILIVERSIYPKEAGPASGPSQDGPLDSGKTSLGLRTGTGHMVTYPARRTSAA